jgi:hypothetical protein
MHYVTKAPHGRERKGLVIEVRRNNKGKLIVRIPAGSSRFTPKWRNYTTYPINGLWYIEGLDPIEWIDRRHY